LLTGTPPGALYIEYPDEYLKGKSVMLTPEEREITVTVWATREQDGSTVIPKSRRFRLRLLEVDGRRDAQLVEEDA
jgi:hypothetical protein